MGPCDKTTLLQDVEHPELWIVLVLGRADPFTTTNGNVRTTFTIEGANRCLLSSGDQPDPSIVSIEPGHEASVG